MPGDERSTFHSLVDHLAALAAMKHASTAQVALAWLLARGVVPLFGTRSRTRLQENARAASIALSRAEVEALSTVFDPAVVQGGRLAREGLASLDRTTA